MIQFSEHWAVNETIIAVTDVKVTYDQFKKAVVASASSKTIIILNPGNIVVAPYLGCN